jgi:hypothetical protein
MLKKIDKIAIFLCVLLLSACKTAMIPSGYRLPLRDVKKEITGSWIDINKHTKAGPGSADTLAGELIAIQNDTLYVLTSNRLVAIQSENVKNAVLYIFINRSGSFAAVTSLVYAPEIIAAIGYKIGAFLLLGIPWVITGTILSAVESGNKSNLLIYPERDRLIEFRDFSRFPRGIPPGVDKSKLHLVTNQQGRSN